MVKKEIHIVFQVLNFLHSDHHLAVITSSIEHLVLINLASHQGIKGICPSITTIARELKVHPDTVSRAIKKWRSLEVIDVQENKGKNNDYFLCIPEPSPRNSEGCNNKKVIHSPCAGAGGHHEKVIHTPRTSAGTPPAGASGTPCTGAGTIYNKEELRKNKEKLLMQKRKAENKKRHVFAESMDQMANEACHIADHEKLKQIEKCSPPTAEFQELRKKLKNKYIN